MANILSTEQRIANLRRLREERAQAGASATQHEGNANKYFAQAKEMNEERIDNTLDNRAAGRRDRVQSGAIQPTKVKNKTQHCIIS
jgi:hypothetical protein